MILDIKKPMNFEEIKNYFSATDEFTVEDLSSEENPPPYLRLTLTDYYTKKNVSTLLSTRINIQHLIRTTTQLKSLLDEKLMTGDSASMKYAKEERTQLEMYINSAIFNYNQKTGGEVSSISIKYMWSTPNSYNVPNVDIEVKI